MVMADVVRAADPEVTRTIGVCIATYNRKSTTLRCLEALRFVDLPENTKLAIYLTDDASNDGTAAAVARTHPEVRLNKGSGELYWGGAMRDAMSRALAMQHDFFLWINDDVELDADAISVALSVLDEVARDTGRPAIVTGATRGRDGWTTYSGMIRSGANPIGFRKIEPDTYRPRRCDSANGNFVLIPAAVAARVGTVDPKFTHRMGDIDYMLRARRLGFDTWLRPGYVGVCEANTSSARWQMREVPLRARWAHLHSPLGLPPREWFRYGYRHGGLLGLAAALANYRWLLFPRPAE